MNPLSDALDARRKKLLSDYMEGAGAFDQDAQLRSVINNLPSNPLTPQGPTFEDTGRSGTGFEKLDSYSGAPFRAAVQQAQMGNWGEVIPSATDQFGKDPETAPSMEQIALNAGVPEEYAPAAGFLGSFAEPGVPGMGAVMGSVKGVKKAGNVYDAAETFMRKTEDDFTRAAERAFPEFKGDAAAEALRARMAKGGDVDLANPIDKIHERVGKDVSNLEGFRPAPSAIAKKVQKQFDDNMSDLAGDELNQLNGIYSRMSDKDRNIREKLLRSQDPSSSSPYNHNAGSDFPLPNYRATIQNNTIGEPYFQEPFNGSFAEPFPWMDDKYKAARKLLEKADGPLTINTSSDLIAKGEYINAIPEGSKVRLFLGPPNDKLGRNLFPGSPSNKRIELAAEKLQSTGIDVELMPFDPSTLPKILTRNKLLKAGLGFTDLQDPELITLLMTPKGRFD